MAGFGILIICSIIGWMLGSWWGFIIGFILLIFWAGEEAKKKKSKSGVTKPVTPVFTGREHAATEVPIPLGPAKPSLEQAREYVASVSHLYACILSFFPNSNSNKVNELTELLKADDWVSDKFGALEELAKQLPVLQAERLDSPMLHQLHNNALLERVLKLPNPMKSRLAMQLDCFIQVLADNDPKECRAFIEKFLQALRKAVPVSSERLDAEDYIMRSGDLQAINSLHEMRRNPLRYKDMLRTGATRNSVLKMAFGVFAGILAADAVRAAMTEYQMKNLLTQLDREIQKVGGVDGVDLQDKELESYTSPEFTDTGLSRFSDNANLSTLDNEPAEVVTDNNLTESIDEETKNLETDTEPSFEVGDSGIESSYE